VPLFVLAEFPELFDAGNSENGDFVASLRTAIAANSFPFNLMAETAVVSVHT
jgi:hypothetical protein